MTDEQINERVAIELMGWRKQTDYDYSPPQANWCDAEGFKAIVDCPEQLEGLYTWQPVTDISAAMQEIEKMREAGDWCCIDMHSNMAYTWRVEFKAIEARNPRHEVSGCATHESLPRAICEAALAAIELQPK